MNIKPVTVNDASTLKAQNETQEIAIVNATAGTFTITLDGKTTTPALTYGVADASAVAAAIGALSTVPRWLTVSGTGAGTSGDPWVITFDRWFERRQACQQARRRPRRPRQLDVLTTITVTGFHASGGTNAASLAQALQGYPRRRGGQQRRTSRRASPHCRCR